MFRLLRFPVRTGEHRVSFHDGFRDPRRSGTHNAIDIGGHEGTPILAATMGFVVRNCVLGGAPVAGAAPPTLGKSGNYVIVCGPDRYFYFYAHMQYVPTVHPGGVVVAGQVIGHMGNTGLGGGTGPVHLHFQVWGPFQHQGADEEYRTLSFRRRFPASVNPYDQLQALAAELPGAYVNRGRRGVIIDPLSPAEAAERERELDALMERSLGESTADLPF